MTFIRAPPCSSGLVGGCCAAAKHWLNPHTFPDDEELNVKRQKAISRAARTVGRELVNLIVAQRYDVVRAVVADRYTVLCDKPNYPMRGGRCRPLATSKLAIGRTRTDFPLFGLKVIRFKVLRFIRSSAPNCRLRLGTILGTYQRV